METFWEQIRFWCAPMEGVMQPRVIRSCNRLDLVSGWMTPFLRISQTVPKPAQIAEFLAPFEPNRRPVVLQLMGVDPLNMAECARRALALGARGIDLNLGCPSRQVARHGAGAGGLREFETTPAVAAALRKVTPEGCFSIKLRCGFHCPAELPAWIATLCRIAAPDAITVHYRTALEGYRPAPGRLERLCGAEAALRRYGVRLIVNGDLATPEETRELMRQTHAWGAMIGRGFWRDPWLLRRLEGQPDCPAPEAGRRRLWNAILAPEPLYEPLSRGQAVELAHLISGRDSAAARELRGLDDDGFRRRYAAAALPGGPEPVPDSRSK